MKEYYVRWGNGGNCLDRTDYLTKEQCEKAYNKIKLNGKITWKEMWCDEDTDSDGDTEYLLKEEEVTKSFDICIEKNNTFSVKGYINGIELKAIKEKLGNIEKYPIGKKIKVYI